MKTLNTILIFLIAVVVGIVQCAIEIPQDYKKCKIGEDFDACMVDAITDALPKLVTGYKSLGLPQLEPFIIPYRKIEQSNGAITLKQEYKNIVISNLLNKSKIEKFSLNLDKKVIQFNFFNELLTATSECTLKGRILILPIEGHGQCSQSYKGVGIEMRMKFEEKIKDGEVYWHFTKNKIVLKKPQNLSVHFANLFNGNKELGDSMNKFINEHWEEVFAELRPQYAKAFSILVLNVINKLFDEVPINKIFLQ